MSNVINSRFTGVLYFKEQDEKFLKQTNTRYFSHWYKWLVIGETQLKTFENIRYDADMIFIDSNQLHNETGEVYMDDVFVHPTEGVTLYPWAVWIQNAGINVTNEKERRKRRLNLKQYPLKIVSPVGHYYESKYNGTFTEYLKEDIDPQRDSGLRCAYILSIYMFEMINARSILVVTDQNLVVYSKNVYNFLSFTTSIEEFGKLGSNITSEVLLETHYWSSFNNESMLRMVQYGVADLAGGYLRCLSSRIEILDYILPIWPFRVGFTYLSERESSSNMYMEPFTEGVWWSCLASGIVLAIMQRVTAKRPEEKEGAFIGVVATWLQQDASAVPDGASGRWSFLVVSVAAMLVHAYYTSAIVSSLMSTGRGGPDSLTALADSKYLIASEDYDYMRYLFWNLDTNWTDLEYLKKKKMTSKLYVDMAQGIELIRDGSTAYHTEYNQIYPHFKTFSDDQLCKLSYVDTIPEQLSWTTATKRSQYTNIFSSSSAWLRETGLTYREAQRLLMKPPPCRASLLAERVKFGDVAPLLGLTAFSAVVSLIMLGVEIFYAKIKPNNRKILNRDVVGSTDGTSVVILKEFDYLH